MPSQVSAPANQQVYPPGSSVSAPAVVDTPRFLSIQYNKFVTTHDTIQRSADDDKLYRCVRQRMQSVWVQTSQARFTNLFTDGKFVVETKTFKTLWNRINLKPSLTDGRQTDWDFLKYTITFDPNTRVYTMETQLQTYSDSSIKGGKDVREYLPESAAETTPANIY